MHTTRKVFFIMVVIDLEGRARERERQSWMLGNFTFLLPGPGKLPVDCECSHLKTAISTFFPFSFPGYCEPAFIITKESSWHTRVPRGRSVTAVYYCAFMQKLRRKMHKNRPQLLVAGPLILHDNARPHIADVVTKNFAIRGGKCYLMCLRDQTWVHQISTYSQS